MTSCPFFHPARVLSPTTTNQPSADLPSRARGHFEQVTSHKPSTFMLSLPSSAKTRFVPVSALSPSHLTLRTSSITSVSHTLILPHSRLSPRVRRGIHLPVLPR